MGIAQRARAHSFGMKIAVLFEWKMSDNTDNPIAQLVKNGEDTMQALATNLAPAPASSPAPAHITTTLYDLVEAISAEVGPDEEHLVTAAVMHLINSNRARFVGSRKTLTILPARAVCVS